MDNIPPMPRMLIVDDDRGLCELLTVWLSHRFLIEAAHDGEAGIERARLNRPDVILLDVMMPKLSGFSLAWVFKHDPRYRGSIVVFITALEVNARTQSQADGYLRKPFTRSEIDAVLEEILARRRQRERAAMPAAHAVEEMSDGKRRAPRVAVNLPATFEVGGSVLEGSIRTLSPWGAFFATDQPVPLHRGGRVRFAAEIGSFELDSYPIYRSRHGEAEGVGLRLRAGAVDVENRLFDLIESYLPREAGGLMAAKELKSRMSFLTKSAVIFPLVMTMMAAAQEAKAPEGGAKAPAPAAKAPPATPAPIAPTAPAATPQDIRQILDVLADAIRTKNDPMRMRMWFRVREQGANAVDALLDGLKNYPEMDVKEYMVKCLSWTKSEKAWNKVLELMKSQELPLRRRATYEICNFDDQRATLPLIDSLKDPDERVRVHATIALGVLDDKRAIPALKASYKSDGSKLVRDFAKKQLELYEINYPEAKVE